jgi:hypothetical protein
MKLLIVALLGIAALPAAQGGQTFTGTISDSMCPNGDHSLMRMGPTAADCAFACVNAHDAMYVLYDGKATYTLSDQQTSEKYAGQKVTVRGTLDAKAKTIKVESITPAK